MSEIIFERRGAAGLVTLNRPQALNALTHAMVVAMKAQLDDWAGDPEISCVVVRGARGHVGPTFEANHRAFAATDAGKAARPRTA